MKSNTIYIKNMVCDRCIKVVGEELEKLGLHINSISLGEVKLKNPPDKNKLEEIAGMLLENGFELIKDRNATTIEKIKSYIINLIHHSDFDPGDKQNYSKLIENELGIDYHHLSSLFSSIENITIEQYIILQKIEKAKELLKYGELTLSEIAYKLDYSSVQHLSNQFKKVTGMTASQFKNNLDNLRKPLDSVKE